MDKDTRELSKQSWNGGKDYESINAGSLQRIADATEKMAVNHIKLQSEYDCMRTDRDWYKEQYYKASRKISALRGVITRLKKK